MTWRTNLALFACIATTTACGGGGGAGDVTNNTGENTLGANLVEPLVGVWQLTSGWSANDPDEALLVFRTPDDDGFSEVVLYDFTDEADIASQCFRPPFGNGEAFTSNDDRVFLDFSEFAEGVISSVDENTITIEFNDADDINLNGEIDDRVTTTLTRVAQVETDIAPLCSTDDSV